MRGAGARAGGEEECLAPFRKVRESGVLGAPPRFDGSGELRARGGCRRRQRDVERRDGEPGAATEQPALREVLPCVAERRRMKRWLDDEGDWVVMSNDRHLQEAIEHCPHTLRLRVESVQRI